MPIPAGIKRKHVLKALADLDTGANHPFGEPTRYELVHNGKRYAPKAIVGLAAKHATGKSLGPDEFSGGEGAGQANHLLRKLGFEVVEKNQQDARTYLLTWNPNNWDWTSLDEDIQAVREHGFITSRWSTGNNKSIKPGDRLFLLKQGVEPRGIIGSGVATSEVYLEPHWDQERARQGMQANRAELEFDALLPSSHVLPLSKLQTGTLEQIHWSTQTSGISIPDDAAAELEKLWASHLRRVAKMKGPPPTDPSRVESIKAIFKKAFPDFVTFENPGTKFKEEEDNYKRQAIANAKQLLASHISGESVLDNDQEAQELAVQVMGLTNFLGWRDQQYIRKELLAKPGRWQRFMQDTLGCMKAVSDDDLRTRLGSLLGWLAELGCSPNVTKILPTYFLSLWQPDRHITIKPAIFDKFLERLGVERLGHGVRLSVAEYERILAVLSQLNVALADWSPRDLMDLHTLYYVVESYSDPGDSEPKPTPATPEIGTDPPYSLDDATANLFMRVETFSEMLHLLRVKKNLILQGPPGTGKTFVARKLAYALMGVKAPDRLAMVQFHQSYSYEDFIQGFRPGEDGGFHLKNGIFYGFCKRASADTQRSYVFIIDEINRGNISKILGELMMLIEPDKRGPAWAIPLTYSTDSSATFYVPENCYLLGMMNTADRSLAMVDYALRRRFAFFDLEPAFGSARFKNHLKESGVSANLIDLVVSRMQALNSKIAEDTANLGPGYRIGHSFFCPTDGSVELDVQWYQRVVRAEIAPIVREYWHDNARHAQSLIDELLAGT